MTAYEISIMGENPRYYCTWSDFYNSFIVRDKDNFQPGGHTHQVVVGTDSPDRDVVRKTAMQMNYQYYGINS